MALCNIKSFILAQIYDIIVCINYSLVVYDEPLVEKRIAGDLYVQTS